VIALQLLNKNVEEGKKRRMLEEGDETYPCPKLSKVNENRLFREMSKNAFSATLYRSLSCASAVKYLMVYNLL